MAWIEAHQSLADHPKVIMVSESLNICEAQVIGHLMFLWWWALDRAPDGNLSEYGARIVERAARWQGAPGAFYDALLAARLMDDDGSIHDWHEYAGRWFDKRAANKQRAQMSRERARTLRAPSAHVATLPTNQPTQPTEREREAHPTPDFVLPGRISRLWETTHGRIVMAHESGELRDMVSAHGEEAVASAIVKSQGKYNPIAYARTVAANHTTDTFPARNGKTKPDGRAPLAENDPHATGVTVTSTEL